MHKLCVLFFALLLTQKYHVIRIKLPLLQHPSSSLYQLSFISSLFLVFFCGFCRSSLQQPPTAFVKTKTTQIFLLEAKKQLKSALDASFSTRMKQDFRFIIFFPKKTAKISLKQIRHSILSISFLQRPTEPITSDRWPLKF